jgi:hypothetical protein
MSRGPGRIERRLHELLSDPRALIYSQRELTADIFGCAKPSKSQMRSVRRALQKLLTPFPLLPVAANNDIAGWRVIPWHEMGEKTIGRTRPPDPPDS